MTETTVGRLVTGLAVARGVPEAVIRLEYGIDRAANEEDA